MTNHVRIIGGKWKRRLVHFHNAEGLRPTPDRLRETLFNWLMWDVTGKSVADICAGSGVLGFEALSRGALHCIFVESHKQQVAQIHQTLQAFAITETDIKTATIYHSTAQHAVNNIAQGSIDILFLDPPYALNLWAILAAAYDDRLCAHALIYVEANKPLTELGLPAHWKLEKMSHVGSIIAGLYRKTQPSAS